MVADELEVAPCDLGSGSPGWRELAIVQRYRHVNRQQGNRAETYHALHVADEQTVENLARLIGVADILEGLGSILAADVQENFLTTAIPGMLA